MAGWAGRLRHAGSLRRGLTLAATGVAGNLLVAGIRRLVPEGAVRRLSVRALAGGIVLGRSTERAMEEARLLAADLMAEAQASLGEESQPTETAHEAHEH